MKKSKSLLTEYKEDEMKRPYQIILILTCVVLVLFSSCGDDKDNPVEPQNKSTTLYLLRNSLSTSPQTGGSVTKVYTYDSSDWTATVACDMSGTECTFGILMAAAPGESIAAKADILIKCASQEKLIASKTFTVASDTFKRYDEPVSCADPQCTSGDQLILRITKVSGNNSPLGVMCNTASPHDSYVEVPYVEIQ